VPGTGSEARRSGHFPNPGLCVSREASVPEWWADLTVPTDQKQGISGITQSPFNPVDVTTSFFTNAESILLRLWDSVPRPHSVIASVAVRMLRAPRGSCALDHGDSPALWPNFRSCFQTPLPCPLIGLKALLPHGEIYF
uniref:Uncharacterized protein n=1 Tax=Gorilla gorilla gorilla TaxID=9595 RepID=A0A2I2Z7K6_GORGO